MRIEEWLGEDNKLGIDIWNRKYRYNGESFDEWLDRVSGGDEQVKKLIKEKKFLFGGRILSNRGINTDGKKVTYSNCFIEGALVYTKDGEYTPIENIKEGDKVLTHKGRFKRVNATMTREYDGNLIVIEGDDFEKIICTENHQFLTNHGWKEAKDLTTKDYLKCILNDRSKLDLISYIQIEDEIYLKVTNTVTVTASDFAASRGDESRTVQVYNLSVEEDNTYTVSNVIVHNCYLVTPPSDSIESIFDCAKKLARTYSYGGGCGVDLSDLAPRGAKVRNAAEESTGAVSFMDLYSMVTDIISQRGRRKRLNTIHRNALSLKL